jgi:hypothetical protein
MKQTILIQSSHRHTIIKSIVLLHYWAEYRAVSSLSVQAYPLACIAERGESKRPEWSLAPQGLVEVQL